jgi:hypothetical protein
MTTVMMLMLMLMHAWIWAGIMSSRVSGHWCHLPTAHCRARRINVLRFTCMAVITWYLRLPYLCAQVVCYYHDYDYWLTM